MHEIRLPAGCPLGEMRGQLRIPLKRCDQLEVTHDFVAWRGRRSGFDELGAWDRKTGATRRIAKIFGYIFTFTAVDDALYAVPLFYPWEEGKVPEEQPIVRFPLREGEPRVVVHGTTGSQDPPALLNLAVHDGYLYWTYASLMRARLDGSNVETLVEGSLARHEGVLGYGFSANDLYFVRTRRAGYEASSMTVERLHL